MSEVQYRNAIGTGSFQGTCTLKENGNFTFNVVQVAGDAMTLTENYDVAWVAEGPSGLFSSPDALCTNRLTQGVVTWTVDLAAFKVLSISPSDPDLSGYVGRGPWFFVKPESLITGSSITALWIDSSNVVIDVQWIVDGSQTLTIQGLSINAYSLMYSGQSAGFWKCLAACSGSLYANGPAVETRLYDAAYGIYLGSSISGKFTYTATNGGWTETYSRTRQITGTNIPFPSQPTGTTVSFATSTSSAITIPSLGNPSPFSPLIVIAVIFIIAALLISFVLYRRRNPPARTPAIKHISTGEIGAPTTGLVAPNLFCRNCGRQLLPDTNFCDKCGTAKT